MKIRSYRGPAVECRTRHPETLGSNPGVAKKKISQRSNQNNTTTNPSAPELNTWNCQRWKSEVASVKVVECRTRYPETLGSNPGVAKKKISHRSNQNNTTTNPSALELNTWNCQRWKSEGAPWCKVLDCRTRHPVVSRFKPWCGQKENLSQVQSEQYHHQSLCTRVKYLKLSEVKIRSFHGTVVECRTRHPEIPGSNPGVAKKKISHRSNQNNTTTNPSASELNTWNCQRWKSEVAVVQW